MAGQKPYIVIIFDDGTTLSRSDGGQWRHDCQGSGLALLGLRASGEKKVKGFLSWPCTVACRRLPGNRFPQKNHHRTRCRWRGEPEATVGGGRQSINGGMIYAGARWGLSAFEPPFLRWSSVHGTPQQPAIKNGLPGGNHN